MSKKLIDAVYVEQVAILLDLQLNPEHQQTVIEFATIQALAQVVNEFPLPDNIQPALVFEP